jgi:hypothetical protein
MKSRLNTETLKLPFVTTRIVVISDFNCPYCFTLNEWINRFGAGDRILWVGVEHRPDLPFGGLNRQEDRTLLKEEVDDVQCRAPEIDIVVPPLWPNSRSALLVQNALEDETPERAHEFRCRIFQRIWLGQEMSSLLSIVQESLRDLELQIPELEPEWLDELTTWWKTHLDRLPCMIAPTGIVYQGLQDRNIVKSFLNSGLRVASSKPGCE